MTGQELWSYGTFAVVIVQLVGVFFALVWQDQAIAQLKKDIQRHKDDISNLERATQNIPSEARGYLGRALATNRDAAQYAGKVEWLLHQLADALGYYHKAEVTTPAGWTKKVKK
jgi:hypothetical protein